MESISEELRMYTKGKSSVKFTTILPGLVTTNLTKNIRLRFPSLFGPYSPREAASLIIDAQRRGFREKIFPSFWLPVSSIIRLLPDKAQMCLVDFFDVDAVADN
ncbi:uncharacterized protein LOC105186439 [Harpegnathos saltator]|uniref:uncharacterized protein LOC105186439 n=1 Tax=Harpegnathos saltator TaxID=610380 RepID=UPI00058D097D|nr:uncharacterized protein LOC105186439 [Harpegnathos saltator]